MAIKSYIDQVSNKTLYKVSVVVRSKIDRNIRVILQRNSIKSLKVAERIEKELIKEATLKVTEREQAGEAWGKVVEKWELNQRFSVQNDFAPKIQPTTIKDNVNALKHYTKEWWKKPISQITRRDVKLIFDSMYTQGKSKSRLRNVKAAINGVFKWAIDEGLVVLERSPAEGFRFNRIEDKKPEILNLNEIRQFLKLAKDQSHKWYSVWATALLTGARSGELFALKWTDVDFDNKRITISKSYCRRSKCIKSTKAGYWREVPISFELETLLKAESLSEQREHVLPRLPRWETGEAAVVLKQFCIGNGIPPVKFHTLRACFATQLIKDGIAPAIVMKICGWRDLKTMQRYVRLAGIEVEGATDNLKLLPENEVMGRVVELFGNPE